MIWFWSCFSWTAASHITNVPLQNSVPLKLGDKMQSREHWGQELNWDCSVIPHSWVWNFPLLRTTSQAEEHFQQLTWIALQFHSFVSVSESWQSASVTDQQPATMEEDTEEMSSTHSWSSGKNIGSDHSCCKESWIYPNTGRGRGWPLFFINGCTSWVDHMAV